MDWRVEDQVESSAAALVDHEHVARRAYQLYCERGRAPGHELDDWIQAEHELRRRADELLARRIPLRGAGRR